LAKLSKIEDKVGQTWFRFG